MVKQYQNNKKTGFTIAEALISMFIMSLFFMASSKMITQRHPDEIQKNPHGYYECYYEGTQLKEHRVDGSGATNPKNVTRCSFVPPKSINFINIHYIDSNNYYNLPEALFNETLTVNNPRDVLDKYNEDVLGDDESLTDDEKAERFNMFKTYLGIAHPASVTYTNWITTEVVPSNVLFIAW